MPLRAIAWIALPVLAVVLGPARCPAQLTITESESPEEPIRQVSLATEKSIAAAELSRTQLRVSVRLPVGRRDDAGGDLRERRQGCDSDIDAHP